MKEKTIELIKKLNEKIEPYKKTLVIPILKILAIIIVCAVIARYLSGGETLSDYASKNPDVAYPTQSIDDNITNK